MQVSFLVLALEINAHRCTYPIFYYLLFKINVAYALFNIPKLKQVYQYVVALF